MLLSGEKQERKERRKKRKGVGRNWRRDRRQNDAWLTGRFYFFSF
jgi:hypothetical protein